MHKLAVILSITIKVVFLYATFDLTEMSDENKLNVNFEWFLEFGKLLINLVHPGKHDTLACKLHTQNILLAVIGNNYCQFSKPRNVHCRQALAFISDEPAKESRVLPLVARRFIGGGAVSSTPEFVELFDTPITSPKGG